MQCPEGPRLELHAQGKTALGEHILDFGQRLLAQIWRLQQLDFGLLHQVADVVDAFGLEAVGGTDRELQIVDGSQQDRIHHSCPDLASLLSRRVKSPKIEIWSCRISAALRTASSASIAPLVSIWDQLVEVGALLEARAVGLVGRAAPGRTRHRAGGDRSDELLRPAAGAEPPAGSQRRAQP